MCVCDTFNVAAQKLIRANMEQCHKLQNNYPTRLLVKPGKTQDGAVGKDHSDDTRKHAHTYFNSMRALW